MVMKRGSLAVAQRFLASNGRGQTRSLRCLENKLEHLVRLEQDEVLP